jgi:hypothetical protein
MSAAEILGLMVVAPERADLALIDLRDPDAIRLAGGLPRDVPRVVVLDDDQIGIAEALGVASASLARSDEPAVLGPLIATALPAARRRATRSVAVTSVRGGVGRSLLIANLARRIAPSRSTLCIDLTADGSLGSWLGVTPSGWFDLEGLADELTAEHLAVVACEVAPGLRLVGGPPIAPSLRLARAAVRAALDLSEIVLLDAPPLAHNLSRELIPSVDRLIVMSYDDPISVACLASADIPEGAWLVASQSVASSIAGRDTFRSLPRAESAVAAAASPPRSVGGVLGRAYDELAEIIAIDAT